MKRTLRYIFFCGCFVLAFISGLEFCRIMGSKQQDSNNFETEEDFAMLGKVGLISCTEGLVRIGKVGVVDGEGVFFESTETVNFEGRLGGSLKSIVFQLPLELIEGDSFTLTAFRCDSENGSQFQALTNGGIVVSLSSGPVHYEMDRESDIGEIGSLTIVRLDSRKITVQIELAVWMRSVNLLEDHFLLTYSGEKEFLCRSLNK